MKPRLAPADSVARRAAAKMLAVDRATRTLAITLDEIAAGRAIASMTVRADMCNSRRVCHGGMIFALADSAFGFACNSHGRPTVAQHCAVTFVASANIGDRLTATAAERHRGRRTGLTEVTIADQHGKLIAIFHGHSYELSPATHAAPKRARTRSRRRRERN